MVYKLNDIHILHLSDLHIVNLGNNNYSKILSNLLESVRVNLAKIEEKTLIIVVTGDIIHKGEKNNIGAAIKFFSDLKEVLQSITYRIYIVPGNHDKKRLSVEKYLIVYVEKLANEKQFDTMRFLMSRRGWFKKYFPKAGG